jgi:hypothetical protein
MNSIIKTKGPVGEKVIDMFLKNNLKSASLSSGEMLIMDGTNALQ